MKTLTYHLHRITIAGLSVLLLSSLCFTFTSCLFTRSEDEPCTHGDTPIIKLGDLDKSRISMYTGNDKLTFINTNTQQEQTYESKSVETYYTAVNTTTNIDQKCQYYDKYECKKITFYSSDSSDKLTVLINLTPRTTFKQIYIHFKQNGYDESLSTFNVAKGYFDSIFVQNKMYYNVYKITTQGGDPTFDKWYAYYTLNEGLIKVKLINGEAWELKDKK